jgi:hypothetical protein
MSERTRVDYNAGEIILLCVLNDGDKFTFDVRLHELQFGRTQFAFVLLDEGF